MNVQTYIESGILELYVAGALSDKENEEVHEMILRHPEVKAEVEQIEAAIIKLTSNVAPVNRKDLYPLIRQKSKEGLTTEDKTKVVTLEKSRYNWVTYTGWAAAILLGAALFWMLQTQDQLESTIANQRMEMSNLEDQVEVARQDLVANQELLNILRDKNIISVPLPGQGNFQEAYAKVYWDKDSDQILLDAQGLPEPPRGMVYQVWSLKLSPLTPTSLGTLDSFISDDNKIFSLPNRNESEAFGITLEPEGGSEIPTMDKLYTLGAVASSLGQ